MLTAVILDPVSVVAGIVSQAQDAAVRTLKTSRFYAVSTLHAFEVYVQVRV